MYQEYFKLKEMPYQITPDPRFMHMTYQHSEALGKCRLTIQEHSGLVVVYGEVGMGKSTIARRLADLSEEDKYQAGSLLNPSAFKTENAFLRAIMGSFGVTTVRAMADCLARFEDFLYEAHEAGQNVVLIIDEAQKLTPRQFSVLHTIHNFESNTEKFIQMVLIGQNELATNIDKLPNFKSRVMRFAQLSSLSAEDTNELIAFRWHAASSGKSSHPFTPDALKAIYLASGGLPREINKLCHESLLIALDSGSQNVTAEMVMEAAQELRLGKKEL